MKHGTYDRAGVFHPQIVRFGRTGNGGAGLFTGGTMAWGLGDPETFAATLARYGTIRAYAEHLGFVYDGPEPAEYDALARGVANL